MLKSMIFKSWHAKEPQNIENKNNASMDHYSIHFPPPELNFTTLAIQLRNVLPKFMMCSRNVPFFLNYISKLPPFINVMPHVGSRAHDT